LTYDESMRGYGAFGEIVQLDYVDVDAFPKLVAALNTGDWVKVADSIPAVNQDVVAPLVNAGTALLDFLELRSDDEAVAAWQAASALVRRQHLAPIKFAASYAPFASAIPVTNPRSLGAPVLRYISAIGRLSANQCALLARPWQMADDVSDVLSKAAADAGARTAEEAAALAAVVTVPMRVSGSEGWAGAKTAGVGGGGIGARARPAHTPAVWAAAPSGRGRPSPRSSWRCCGSRSSRRSRWRRLSRSPSLVSNFSTLSSWQKRRRSQPGAQRRATARPPSSIG